MNRTYDVYICGSRGAVCICTQDFGSGMHWGIQGRALVTSLLIHFYRPQRSCEGYVFTGVCLSTGGCLPQCMLGYHPPRSRHPPPGADTPRSRHPPGADIPPGADSPRSRHPPGADNSPGADTPLEQTPPPPGRDGYCCGRYASYWNAFFFLHFLALFGKYYAM